MSLITQCPACNTLFKVVSDQLKISQGWVRCGQCKEVFDANEHWFKTQKPAAEAEEKPAPSDNTMLLADAVGPEFAPEQKSIPAQSESLISQPGDVEPTTYKEAAEQVFQDKNISVIELDSLKEPPKQVEQVSTEFNHDPVISKLKDKQQPESTPGFIREAQSAQRWQSPWARFGLGVFGIVLSAAVALQVTVHERDRIAAFRPKTQPLLVDICKAIGCTLAPLKHIDSVVVDSSGFNKIRSEGKNDLYKATLTLKNAGAMKVAIPHIELSLNDSQDQTVLRRVLSPADLGAVQFELSPRSEFSANAVVQIDTTQMAGLKVAGYRIWAFYP